MNVHTASALRLQWLFLAAAVTVGLFCRLRPNKCCSKLQCLKLVTQPFDTERSLRNTCPWSREVRQQHKVVSASQRPAAAVTKPWRTWTCFRIRGGGRDQHSVKGCFCYWKPMMHQHHTKIIHSFLFRFSVLCIFLKHLKLKVLKTWLWNVFFFIDF